ncbi:MAG: DMT family transporter [Syntrophomonadaceae bacterium]|nr:DMT family transporter [Syntrophomonadaceae bacterium]
MTSKSPTIDPRIILLAVPVIWGINFTVMKIGLQSLSPLTYNTSRLIVATFISWILVFILKSYQKVEPADWQAIIVTSLLGFALPQIGITIGVSLTTAGNCSLIMSLIPVSVWIINSFLGQEIVTKWATRGVFLSFSGVFLIILGTGSGLSISSSDLLGIVIILGAQFCCAYYTVFSKPLVEKYSPYQVIAYTMTISTLVFIIISFSSLVNVTWTELPSSAWLSIFYSGILALAAGNFIWVWGVREIGSTSTAIFSNVTPIFAILTGCIVLKESLGMIQIIGAIIILTGLVITQRAQRIIIVKEEAAPSISSSSS